MERIEGWTEAKIALRAFEPFYKTLSEINFKQIVLFTIVPWHITVSSNAEISLVLNLVL